MYRYRVIACLVPPEALLQAGMWPDVPMFTVARGDVVRMRIADGSGAVHPDAPVGGPDGAPRVRGGAHAVPGRRPSGSDPE